MKPRIFAGRPRSAGCGTVQGRYPGTWRNFSILSTHCPLGRRGQYKRLFLTEDELCPDAIPGTAGGSFKSAATAKIIEGHYPARQTQKAPPLMAGAAHRRI